MKNAKITVFTLFLIILYGCMEKGPAVMHYGEDQCAYCKMNVADAAFGTQLISSKGKVFKFDSIECLAAFELKEQDNQTNNTRWLADVNKPGSFLSSSVAVFVHGSILRSPMGLGLAATSSVEDGQRLATETNGKILTWEEVQEYVSDAWDIK